MFDENNTTETIAGTGAASTDLTKYSLHRTMCSTSKTGFNTLLTSAAIRADSSNWENATDDLIDRYGRNYTPKPGEDSTSELSKLYTIWTDVNTKYSLWNKLNESSYITTKSEDKEYLGHSEDSTSEMMATVTNVSLNYPNQVIEMMEGLSPKDQAAIKQSIAASYMVIGNRYPELEPYLNSHYMRFIGS